MTCSECGFEAKAESALYPPRRRLKIMVIGLVLMSPRIVTVIEDHYGPRWWLAPVPDTWLVASLPLARTNDHPLFVEVTSRLATGSLNDSAWKALMLRCLEGDAGAPAGSRLWEQKYGRIVGAWGERLSEDPDLARQALDVPPRIEIEPRGTLVSGGPACVAVSLSDWWPDDTVARVTIEAAIDGRAILSTPVIVEHRSEHDRGSPLYLPLKGLPPGDSTATFTLRVSRTVGSLCVRDDEFEPITLEAPLKAVSSLNDVMRPLSDADLAARVEAAIRQGVTGTVYRLLDGERRIRTAQLGEGLMAPDMTGMAIGLRVEVLRESDVRHTLFIWGEIGPAPRQRRFQWCYSPDGRSFADDVLADGAQWSVRVRSDPSLAARVSNATRFWEGEFTVPASIREMDEPGWTEEWVILEGSIDPSID
jgi:hypothetical protein